MPSNEPDGVEDVLLEYRVRKLEEMVSDMKKRIEDKLDGIKTDLWNLQTAPSKNPNSTVQNVFWGPIVSSLLSSLILWFILRVLAPHG